MAILENRVKATNVVSIMKKAFSNWKWVANYDEALGVYGMHTIQDRNRLWEDLKIIMDGVSGPSLIIGDFNTILSSEDRVQGNSVQEIEVRDFKNFILGTWLDELKTVGRKFTWTNNHIHSRIDRILVNAEWIQKWPAMEGIIMNHGFSDHYPLSVANDGTNQEGRRPLKFLNCLESHQDFGEIVKQF
ncbi:uncharacterized protein [Nicotiana tomentosiformis]|uniref:uncharacterized protein n=1 Tax=Nicotiana tomentosiformis TaxID=4098 RepID=UPI00388CAB81